MYQVDLYRRVRLACHHEGLSKREAARRFGVDRKTVDKILRHSVPPGYRRSKPVRRPKLDPFTGLIDTILEEDKTRPRKQRHTAKRIYERLCDEHGFEGGITIVKDYVRERRQRSQEVFVPLTHAPGHAQVDFGTEPLTGALLDRLTQNVHILEMNGESYRLAHCPRIA